MGCLLEYKYIKNHYRLIAVDLSRQKEPENRIRWTNKKIR